MMNCKNCGVEYTPKRASRFQFCGRPCSRAYTEPGPGLRRCSKCEQVKTEDNFAAKLKGSGQRRYICKACALALGKDWRRSHPENEKVRQSKYYEKNKGEARNLYKRNYHRRLRLQALEALGGRCACCGETTVEFLAIDHINGGGTAHRKALRRHGSSTYLELKRRGYPKGEFQVLCHNCNLAKGFYGACPHENKST